VPKVKKKEGIKIKKISKKTKIKKGKAKKTENSIDVVIFLGGSHEYTRTS
jgi:hypothetical protein